MDYFSKLGHNYVIVICYSYSVVDNKMHTISYYQFEFQVMRLSNLFMKNNDHTDRFNFIVVICWGGSISSTLFCGYYFQMSNNILGYQLR